MTWKEIEGDVKIGQLADAFRHRGCLSTLNAAINMLKGIRVYAVRSCINAVKAHVRLENRELGGLLLGRVYQVSPQNQCPANMLTIITRALPSLDYYSSAISLEMNTEVWARADEYFVHGDIIVGWYHSHPNIGAFFSGRDHKTQQAFFYHDYSLGLVVDPIRKEQKLFFGKDGAEYRHPIIPLDHWLDVG